jgi:uncharacterized membrane protein
MEFRRTVSIARPVTAVFAFMKDFENHPQEKGSKVLLVDKITPDRVNVGTRYREKVQMLPLLAVNMISEIKEFKPEVEITYLWQGGGMRGNLRISFVSHDKGTILTVHEWIDPRGLMKIFAPIIGAAFRQTWEERLQAIKEVLESGSR